MYKRRHLDKVIETKLKGLPVILVDGAKNTGKTRTCEQFSKTKLYMDDLDDYEIVNAGLNNLLNLEPTILIDEWQKFPSVWDFARRCVDRNIENGFMLLTGSIPTKNNTTHSGAGRIVRVKMRPFSIEEREMNKEHIRISDFLNKKIENINALCDKTTIDYLDEIFKSGLPGIRTRKEAFIKDLLKSYVENVVNKEIDEYGLMIKKPKSLMNWLKSYAAAIGTTTSYQTIINSVKNRNEDYPTRKTADNYRDILYLMGIIEELDAWVGLGEKFDDIGKAPKHYIVDPALLEPLLNVSKEMVLKGDVPTKMNKIRKSYLGQLFENFIYQSLIIYCEINDAKMYHFRTKRGDREIDFIIESKTSDVILAIEAKTASSINDNDVKHLNWFEKIMEKENSYLYKIVIYTGKYAYQRKDKVYVIPAALLGL